MPELDLRAYQAASEGVAHYVVSGPGFIRIAGDDRLDFLQRQTTNDAGQLSLDQAVLTVLTSPTARILDVFYLLHLPDTIGVVTLPHRSESTTRYLKSRIFFMDKVTVELASQDFAQVDIIGPESDSIWQRLGMERSISSNQVSSLNFNSSGLLTWGLNPEYALGSRILVPAQSLDLFLDFLTTSGSMSLRDDEYQVLRVEHGLPAADSELSEDYTPLEVGLRGAVSERKGCYTGQEVLARQVTYDKITRQLRRVCLDGPMSPGARLWSTNGDAVGELTSVVDSPRLGAVGLAIIKRPHDQVGTKLIIGEESNSTRIGEVCEPLL
jgi:folate-binding protein YgfZ